MRPVSFFSSVTATLPVGPLSMFRRPMIPFADPWIRSLRGRGVALTPVLVVAELSIVMISISPFTLLLGSSFCVCAAPTTNTGAESGIGIVVTFLAPSAKWMKANTAISATMASTTKPSTILIFLPPPCFLSISSKVLIIELLLFLPSSRSTDIIRAAWVRTDGLVVGDDMGGGGEWSRFAAMFLS